MQQPGAPRLHTSKRKSCLFQESENRRQIRGCPATGRHFARELCDIEDLIANKVAVGRLQDLADVEALQAVMNNAN
jgi:hypothetical protein